MNITYSTYSAPRAGDILEHEACLYTIYAPSQSAVKQTPPPIAVPAVTAVSTLSHGL